jgi:hypothetical protein
LIDAYADRVGEVTALGLDATLFCREGKWRTPPFEPETRNNHA